MSTSDNKNSEASTEVFCDYTDEGLVFRLGEKIVGPLTFQDPEDSNSVLKIASELGVDPKVILAAKLKAIQKPITILELNRILATTVKRDEPAKAITFLGMLNAQTEEDQFNLAYQAESSTGKSYIPLELIAYFPEDDQRIYAGASPTSFFHEIGQWDKNRKVIVVDLAGKIVIFMDQPHWMLMERLRPLLSHDRKVLVYKITDKREKAGLRTKTVEILGYPTVVFCTAKPTLEDQERTRLWLLSPEITHEKLLDSLRLITAKETHLQRFRIFIESHPLRRWLKARIEGIRNTGIRNVVIPNGDRILDRFLTRKTHLNPRDTRDYPRLLRLIKANALLNCFAREKEDHQTIIANDDDVEAGFQLYESVAKSNELGLSPETYRIFEDVIIPLSKDGNGITRKEITHSYFELYHRPLADDRLRRQIIPALESAGLVSQEANPMDRREMLLYPTVSSPISPLSQPEEYRGKNSGVNPCEKCGSLEAKMHLIPNKGTHWLCDRCLQDYEGKV